MPAGAELAQHQHGRPVRAELALLLARQAHDWRGRSRAAARSTPGSPASRAASAAVGVRRHDRQRQRHRRCRAATRAAVERRRRCRRHRRRATTARPSRPASRQRASSVVEGTARRSCQPSGCSAATVAAAAARVAAAGSCGSRGRPSARSMAAARRRRRQRLGRHDCTRPRSASRLRAIGLLGLARRGERHQHGAVGVAQGLHRPCCSPPGRSTARIAQQGREVARAPARRRCRRAAAAERRCSAAGRFAPTSRRQVRSASGVCGRAAIAARSSGAPTAPPPTETMTSPLPSAGIAGPGASRLGDIAGIDGARSSIAAQPAKLRSKRTRPGSPWTSTARKASKVASLGDALRRGRAAHDVAHRARRSAAAAAAPAPPRAAAAARSAAACGRRETAR